MLAKPVLSTSDPVLADACVAPAASKKRSRDTSGPDASTAEAPPAKQFVSSYPPCSPPPEDFLEIPVASMPPPSPMTALFRPVVDKVTKYVVVSGGVCSSLGKGVATSSIGALLRGHGFRVTAIKMDPYLNIDAGLMSPYEHGEVFVLDDGGETDLDLGNYERMMYLSLRRDNNITTGKVYDSVIKRERRGDYLGKTVQVVPHITGAIIEWLNRTARECCDGTGMTPQICMIELGGTVGDIESMPFIESLRQLKFSLPDNSLAWCHCSYVPDMSGQKTKPTQHSVKALLALGIQPDVIICRCAEPLADETRKKISNQCNIPAARILSCHNVDNLFHVPRVLAEQHVMGLLNGTLRLEELHMSLPPPARADSSIQSLDDWKAFARSVDEADGAQPVVIAFVGKYNKGGGDAYQSVLAALHHAAVAVKRKLQIEWIDAVDLEKPKPLDPTTAVAACNMDDVVRSLLLQAGEVPVEDVEVLERCRAAEEKLRKADGVFVPGGFGDRGVEGKARAAGLAREWKKPYLGVCLGMQVAIMQFARDCLGLEDATSEEFDKDKLSKNHVIMYMPEISKETMGANMRLGTRWVEFPAPDTSIGAGLYGGASRIMERHRHRYEFNVVYKEQMEQKGLIFSGQDESKERMDVIELCQDEHPFYLAVQFHPEYKSRPGMPSPPFHGFVAAASRPEETREFISGRRRKGPDAHWTPAKP